MKRRAAMVLISVRGRKRRTIVGCGGWSRRRTLQPDVTIEFVPMVKDGRA